MMSKDQNTLTLEDVQRILKEKGITMSVAGCGCCGSPSVEFTCEGETFSGDDANFHMHEIF